MHSGFEGQDMAFKIAFVIGALISITLRGVWLIVLPAYGTAYLMGWL